MIPSSTQFKPSSLQYSSNLLLCEKRVMADPLSGAGLVAGVLSLGLQAYQGISTYLDAVQCRAVDLASVRRKNEALCNILKAIEDSLPRLKSRHQLSTSALTECLKSCKATMDALEKTVIGILECGTTGPQWLRKMKKQAKKLSYALDRPKLQELETRLDQTISELHLALQSIGK